MKKNYTILALFLSMAVCAQSFTGKALYQSKRIGDIKIESKGMGGAQQAQLQEMLKKRFEKVYELHFHKTTSLYYEQEKLATPTAKMTGGIQIVIEEGSNNKLYKDIKEETYVDKRDMMGKLFLIEDHLEKLDWKLEKESKKIGNYTCFKAVAIEEYEHKKFMTDSITLKSRKIIAWYTPEIPVSHGPGKLYGLPGLILEVAEGKNLLLCTKIVLNPLNAVLIKQPRRGKKVSQKKYDIIKYKKSKEIMKRFRGSRKKGKGNQITIEVRD